MVNNEDMSAPAIDRPARRVTPRTAQPRPAAKRKRSPGWVPNQHGAWAMLIAPYVVGLVATIADGRFELADVTLFGFWMIGYFAFFATSLWLKSRRKARYFPPVRTYLVASSLLGVLTLVLQPRIWSWALAFAPILLVGLWFAYQRDERSLASGATTVAAACLIPAVVYADGLFDFVDGLGTPGYDRIAIIAGACFGYFFGTVLYVKTMIRERGHVSYIVASVLWHALCAVAVLVTHRQFEDAGIGFLTWEALALFFAVMTARALAVPLLWPMRGKNLSAKQLGIGEIFSTLALVAILIVAVA